MEADFEDHLDEELDIIVDSICGSDTLDDLEMLYAI